MTSIRYDVGKDYFIYYNYYNKLMQSQNYRWESLRLEYLYFYIVKIFNYYNLHFSIFLFTLILLTIVLITRISNYLKISLFFTFYMYIVNGNLFTHFNLLRQSISIIFFITSFEYITKKKKYTYIILLLFAGGFHRSALILLPCYFFLGKLLKIKTYIVILIFSFIMKVEYIISLLIVFLSTFKIQYYIKNYFTSNYFVKNLNEVSSTGLGNVFRNILFIIILYNYKKIQKYPKFIPYINAYFISLILSNLFIKMSLLARFIDYFSISIIFLYPFFKIKRYKVLEKIIYLVFFIMFLKIIIFDLERLKLSYKIFDIFNIFI